jgi:CRP-like cAMP-binding protein
MLSFLIAHWVGCAWFLVGRLEGYGTNEWVPSMHLVRSSLLTQYVRALYWGFVNTTNIESASPTNTVEALFSLGVLFVGVSMYATIIGNVGSLLSNLDSTAVMFREKLDSITAYMHYKEIPPAIQARVHDYYEYLWHRQKGLDESEILRDLPNSMRTDIALYLNRDVLEKVPFFQNASENLLSVLVKLLKPQVCAPGEFIIRFGDIGREMYFINRGVVVVCSEDGKNIYNVLSDGSFFGEYALLFSQKRSASVQSSTYCDLFVLTQEDFQTVLNDFPEFALAMRKEGVKRIIEKLSFFKDFSKEFRDMLVELLRAQSFVGGEYIVRKGDIGHDMYFLMKGTAEVCSGK